MNSRLRKSWRSGRRLLRVFLILITFGPAAAEQFPVLSVTEKADLKGGIFLSKLAAGRPARWSEIKRLPFSAWKRLSKPAFNASYSPDTFALRLALKNAGETPIWYLRIPNNRLDYVDFRLETSGTVREYRTGDHRAWKGNEPAAYPVFRFRLPPGETAVLFMRVRSGSQMDLSFFLESAEEFGAAKTRERVMEIVMLISFVLVIALQYFLHGGREPLMQIYCSLMLVFGGLWLWLQFGNGPFYLYPDSVWWRDNGIFLFSGPAITFAILFMREFLSMGAISRRIDAVLLVSALPPLLVIPLVFLDTGAYAKHLVLVGSIPLEVAAVLAAFYVSFRAGRTWSIRIFLLWLAFMIVSIMHHLMTIHFLPHSQWAVYAMVIMIPIWAVFGLGALGWRVWALKRERDETLERMVALLRDEKHRETNETPIPSPANSPASGAVSRQKRVLTLDTENLMEGLMRLVKQEKLYLHEELTLEDFADRLGIRADQLSALLNLKMGVSFSRLINQHRIEEACRRLVAYPEQTVLRIGLDCGFGSRTAFNREFKRHLGLTPAAYRKREAEARTA